MKYMNDQQKIVGSLRMGNGKRESNGCTVHFNSILQLLIYKPQSINKTLIKLEISKEASFFFLFFIVLYFLFSFTFEHYKGFFSRYSLYYYLINTSIIMYFRSIQHISLPGCFEIKEMRQEVGKMKTTNTSAAGKVFFRIHTIHSINDV